MEAYLKRHLDELYTQERLIRPGLERYQNISGWRDCFIGRHLVFSHRKTPYTFATFPDKFHSHKYLEIVIYHSGDITYVADDLEITPTENDILILPSGCNHATRLSKSSTYERDVLYISPAFFTDIGKDCIPEVFSTPHASCRSVYRESRGEFLFFVEKLKDILFSNSPNDTLLAYSYVLHLLYLISNATTSNEKRVSELPSKILELKRYVDTNFASISTVQEVADQFYFSREYISRLFKQYFTINLSEYLSNKKLDYARHLLLSGKSVGYACDASGFHSTSAFVNAFRAKYGDTPTKYKRNHSKR